MRWEIRSCFHFASTILGSQNGGILTYLKLYVAGKTSQEQASSEGPKKSSASFAAALEGEEGRQQPRVNSPSFPQVPRSLVTLYMVSGWKMIFNNGRAWASFGVAGICFADTSRLRAIAGPLQQLRHDWPGWPTLWTPFWQWEEWIFLFNPSASGYSGLERYRTRHNRRVASWSCFYH